MYVELSVPEAVGLIRNAAVKDLSDLREVTRLKDLVDTLHYHLIVEADKTIGGIQ